MFQFPLLCQGRFVWCYSYFTEWAWLSVPSCAVLGKKRKTWGFLSLYLSFCWVKDPSDRSLWGLGGCRWVLWGWNCGVLCLSSYSKVAARHHCSRRALYSQCTVYQPKLWPVKSWLTPNFFRSSCVERQLLCQNWFWAMCRLFQLLKGKGCGTFVDKAVKLIWLVFCY